MTELIGWLMGHVYGQKKQPVSGITMRLRIKENLLVLLLVFGTQVGLLANRE